MQVAGIASTLKLINIFVKRGACKTVYRSFVVKTSMFEFYFLQKRNLPVP